METKTTEYCLLESVSSVEDFFKSEFHASGNKIKKHFQKNFLNRSFNQRAVLQLPINFINDGMINPEYQGTPIETIFEDENFFVFSKNPDQFIHPLTYEESDNCLSFIRKNCPKLLSVNSKNYDRGLLYRLDYETSGVVIYVKNDDLYNNLRENFRAVAKEKKYWCWVEGEMKHEGSLTHLFESCEEKGRRVVVRENGTGAGAPGEIATRALEFNKITKMTLVEVTLKTGLRHQIRAQMAYFGHALIGDTFYGGRKAKRLYLHALSYSIFIEDKIYNWVSEPHEFNGL